MSSVKTLRQQELLFTRLFEELTQLRIDQPRLPLHIAKRRQRLTRLTSDGKLNILAADHPARRVVKSGNNKLAMADRQELLTRIIRIASANAVDGIMATMDIIEELLLLDDLMQHKNLPGFLNDKSLIVSLNRGGLNNTSWELDDPLTGPHPEQCADWNMDGVKMLWRNCDEDINSLKTMRYCADAITASNKLELPFFLEPLPVVRTTDGIKVVKEATALAELVGVASALGDSSRNLWLKLPQCDDLPTVARATTLPIVLLGGESANSAECLQLIKEGMSAHHNVRGTMIGRNVLFPADPDQDPVTMAMSIHELIHQ